MRSKRLLAIAACVTLVGCGSGEAAEATRAAEPPPALIEVHRVERQPFGATLEIPANVLPMKQVQVIPRVPGVIEQVLVDEGDLVAEGQVVAALETRDYLLAVREAQANLMSARANAKLARIMSESASTTRDRMESLHQTEAISQSKMDQATDGQRMSAARRDAALAQVQQAEVGLAAARTKLTDTEIRAPYAGLVIKRMMDEGEICGMMPPGIIMIIADVTRMKVEGSVGEMDLHRIREGMPATVRVDALGHAEIQGTVELVSPMVDPRTRTAGVRVVVDNPDQRLEAGMSAEIVIDLGGSSTLAVPVDALLGSERGDQAAVFVVDAEGRARRRPVRLGERQGEMFPVLGGLAEGERIVRSGQAALADGQRVTVAERHEGAE